MEDEDTSGFYGIELLYGPNFVETPTFSLDRDNAEDRLRTDLPFRWFDSAEDARAHHNYIPYPEVP